MTANSNADAGRSSGAQVTLVTKSGTNRFHGSAYEYYRNRYFAANDWFTKKAQAASKQPNKPGQLTRNTFGGTIGGPILKDKLFFFFNYEGQRTRESASITQEVPTAAYRTGTLQYKDTSGATRVLLRPRRSRRSTLLASAMVSAQSALVRTPRCSLISLRFPLQTA